MSSIESASTSSSSGSSSDNGTISDSLVSMKTEDHEELYDHRQHTDFISTQIEQNNINKFHIYHNNGSNTVDISGDKDEAVADDESGIEESNAITEKIKEEKEDARLESTEFETTDNHRLGTLPQMHNQHRFSASAVPKSVLSKQIKPIVSDNRPNLGKPSKSKHHTDASGNLGSSHHHHHDSATPSSPKLRPRRLSKAHSLTDMFHSKSSRGRPRGDSVASSHSSGKPAVHLHKTSSHKSAENVNTNTNNNQQINDGTTNPNSRRRESFDSDKSQASRESQETEEDVWVPMSPQLHTRINGIDFDELEEFSQLQREKNAQYMSNINVNGDVNVNNQAVSTSSSTLSMSSAALKYTPRPSAQQQINSSSSNENNINVSNIDPEKRKRTEVPGVSFGNNKIEGDSDYEKSLKFETGTSTQDIKAFLEERAQLSDGLMPYSGASYVAPDRFSFFCSSAEETVHSTDIPSLVTEGQTFYNLLKGGEPTWWLDCSCPTDDEMRCIAKAFGIHPLTAEDIRMQETREKVELFKSYYFVCFHTFENDKESEDFLEPINVYIVVFRSGVLTFHFNPISHSANVRRRVRQLRDYVDVNSDWICYALIDDITDSFAPVIQSIEYEADVIEDSVFMARDIDFSIMLQKIGESRRKTMTLMRLLSGKADVIKMFAKRCQDEANGIGPALTSQINIANLQANINSGNSAANTLLKKHLNSKTSFAAQHNNGLNGRMASQPRAEIAMYLGDIQDHLLTMYQNLAAYEKIFSRSHSNYLAQLQVESFNSNNKVTEMLGKVTMIGTMLVPLNVITGLFGMNVTIPGQDKGSLAWWFGILGVLVFLGICGWFIANWWVTRIAPPKTLNEAAISGAKSVISSFLPKYNHDRRAREQTDEGNKRSDRSMASMASRYSRYQ